MLEAMLNHSGSAPDIDASALLPESMLQEFRKRAATLDAENEFFERDLSQLQAAGYLAAPVPKQLGGAGFGLEDLISAQRRLASYAPATALGVNMHLVWVQVARYLHDRSTPADARLDWVMREAVAGEIFAFGISEAGNEAVLLDSFSQAEPQSAGGYLISGSKVFTTLSPVWTRLGVHAKDESDPDDPRLVFGFLRREASGVRAPEQGSLGLETGSVTHPGTWNPLGMRATQSWNTQLQQVPMKPVDVAATLPPFDPSDPLVLAIFSSFSLLTAAVYAGIADRALDLVREVAASPQRSDAHKVRMDDPDTAAKITEAMLEHRASIDSLTVLARDIDAQRDRDDWFIALAACRNRVCDEARSAVELAMRLTGSRSFQADSELARLMRDSLAGLFHPSSSSALANTIRMSLLTD